MHLVRHMKSSTSETKPFQSRSRVEIFGHPGEKKAEPFQIEIAVLNCFRRQPFHELKKRSASETGLIVHIKQNKTLITVQKCIRAYDQNAT